jgi:uncharacterized protein YndB with AHSA1/START domain
MNASLETVNDRPALRFERRLDFPVERVWRAVSEPAELAQWFPGSVDWKPELGEAFEAEGRRGEITELDPPHLIAWTFGADDFRFELRRDGDGCLLVFTHGFDDRALGAQHAGGWEAYFKRLDVHLGGGYLSEEEAHDVVPAMQRRYAESFGLR